MEARSTPRTTNHSILATGFDPFGGLTVNPSADLALELGLDETLRIEILPTSYKRAWERMRELLREQPHSILMFGYSRGSNGLRLERCAHNEDRSAEADNDGQTGDARIVDGASATLPARTNVDQLHRVLVDANTPASISDDAGGYVCNHVYFRTLEALASGAAAASCVFIHVGDWRGTADEADVIRGAQLLVAEMVDDSRVVSTPER